MDHEEKAKELFKEGYNCAQSVFGAFQNEMNIDMQTALKLSSSFGGGMGRLREVCGAVSGMFMVAGMLYGYDDPKNQRVKAKHYARIQELANEFKEHNKSIVCRDLLGLDRKTDSPIPEERTKEYYDKRPCIELVGQAAKIIENYIKENEKMKIAVTYKEGQIFQHFGHAEQFKVYEVKEAKIVSSEVIPTMGSGHGALAVFLSELEVDTLICGGIGGGAKSALQEAGITLYGGVNGDADKAVEKLLANKLDYNADIECSHHNEGEHNCGEHSCGSH